MKNLIIILGPNGVGKSTVSAALMRILPNCAYIDSDSLRMMNPAWSYIKADGEMLAKKIRLV